MKKIVLALSFLLLGIALLFFAENAHGVEAKKDATKQEEIYLFSGPMPIPPMQKARERLQQRQTYMRDKQDPRRAEWFL